MPKTFNTTENLNISSRLARLCVDGEVYSESVREAQYGGKGGGSGAYSPGGSPMGMGGTSQGGYNKFAPDMNMEAVLDQSRQNNPYDEEDQCVEAKLSRFHVTSEPDAINSKLTPKERQKHRIRQYLWERRKNTKDCADSIAENSPSYIKKYFGPKPEHVRTMEESLKVKRTNKIEKNEREETLPQQDSPTRTFEGRYSSQDNSFQDNSFQDNSFQESSERVQRLKIGSVIENSRNRRHATMHGRTSPFDSSSDDDEEQSGNYHPDDNWTQKQMSTVGIYNNDGPLSEDQYGSAQGNAENNDNPNNTIGGVTSTYGTADDTLAFGHPGEDEFHYPGKPVERERLDSSLPEGPAAAQDTSVGMEDRLRRLKVKEPQTPPHNMQHPFNLDEIEGQKGLQDHIDDQSPDTSSGQTPTL